MKVEVRFFAICRDIADCESLTLDLPIDATGEFLWDKIIAKIPRLEPFRKQGRLAVNLEYVKATVLLHDGDEICIIPPVSGG